MTEPLLLCCYRRPCGVKCGRVYAEREARRSWGKHKGRLIGPCSHGLHLGVYIDPTTRRVLVPYNQAA